MPNDKLWFEESDDELRDDEYPEESDDDTTETVACPHCGAEIYEDTVRCPVCEDYITPGANANSQRPLWWIVLGLAGVLATLLALSGFLVR